MKKKITSLFLCLMLLMGLLLLFSFRSREHR